MSKHEPFTDVAGHYARPDVFELTVHREPRPMITSQGEREHGQP